MYADQGILMFSLHFMNTDSLYCEVWISLLVFSIEEQQQKKTNFIHHPDFFLTIISIEVKEIQKCHSFIYAISKFKYPLAYNLTQNMECEVYFDIMERKCNELSTSVLLCIMSFTIELFSEFLYFSYNIENCTSLQT